MANLRARASADASHPPIEIRVVTPITTTSFRDAAALQELSHPGLVLSHSYIDSGPASIESALEELLAGPGAARKVADAAADGVDAAVIDCFGDPGLDAARELVRIPVVGAGQASLHVASMLGFRFSIVTTLQRVFHLNAHEVERYGLSSQLASFRAVDEAVLDLDRDKERLVGMLTDQATAAVREDGAHVIVFGCTGMSDVAVGVRSGLESRGISVPVVEPMSSAVRLAEALVRLGLTHSQITYPAPPPKKLIGFEFPGRG
ncbi:MAG TPA: aspartate/glutamate racemase family protein [Patescibacteria group bacterium]|nr:aspartate/glutamate racemase family protein [Patescibacteria group bacterium]